MKDDTDLFELIERLYGAAEAPKLWGTAIEAIVDAFDSRGGHVVLFDSEGSVFGGYVGGFPPEISAEYERDYAHRDLRTKRMMSLPKLTIATDQTLLTPSEIKRCPSHQELFPKVDVIHTLMTVGRLPDGGQFSFGVLRSAKIGPYEKNDMAVFGRLMRHLERALGLELLTGSPGKSRGGADAALCALGIGIVMLDHRQRVIQANPRAEAMLASNDGLSFCSSRIDSTRSGDQKALSLALNRAIHGTPRQGSEVLVCRPSGRKPYVLQITPVLPNVEHVWPEATAALVIIRDPEDRQPVPAETLAETYELTPAEAAMAVAVGSGTRLDDYAEQSEIAISTARWRLKQVLAKTDTHRQAELARLVTLLSTPKPRHEKASSNGSAQRFPNPFCPPEAES